MKNEKAPAELIGKFENISDAVQGFEQWKKENRRPGRPRTRDTGISLGTLRQMVKGKAAEQ
jgi:hypothetical protein